MEPAALIRAILDDPDNDSFRLAYADWLEAVGQAIRAEWIRVSCAFARVPSSDPQWSELLGQILRLFPQCRPAWWEEITGIDQRNVRGMYRFNVGAAPSSRSATTYRRLGKVAWLATAAAEGWLERIDVMICDAELADVIMAWKAPALQVPLLVRPAPQMTDEGLRKVLALPMLQGLNLVSNVLRNPAALELASYPGLRDLTVELRLVAAPTADAVVGQIAQMTALRRLRLEGHNLIEYGDRPNDQDLLRLQSLSGLKRLELSSCPAVSSEAITELQRIRPTLTVVRTE